MWGRLGFVLKTPPSMVLGLLFIQTLEGKNGAQMDVSNAKNTAHTAQPDKFNHFELVKYD